MSDLISRQAAIDAIEEVDWYHVNPKGELVHGANSNEDVPLYKANDIYDTIKKLPSAQPEIIRCKDCNHSYDGIGGTFCSYGICVGCVVETDFFCRDGERREDG